MSHMEQDIAKILFDEKEIGLICDRLAAEITRDYADSERKLVVLSILKGSLPFTADLIKRIPLPLELDFMKVSSYGSRTTSSGTLNKELDLNRDDIEKIDILIVEDIIDSGNTLSRLKADLLDRKAHSVKICTLLDKPSRREKTLTLTPDYSGAVIPDEFVVGYGLDYGEKYRNLPYVGVLKPEVYKK